VDSIVPFVLVFNSLGIYADVNLRGDKVVQEIDGWGRIWGIYIGRSLHTLHHVNDDAHLRALRVFVAALYRRVYGLHNVRLTKPCVCE